MAAAELSCCKTGPFRGSCGGGEYLAVNVASFRLRRLSAAKVAGRGSLPDFRAVPQDATLPPTLRSLRVDVLCLVPQASVQSLARQRGHTVPPGIFTQLFAWHPPTPLPLLPICVHSLPYAWPSNAVHLGSSRVQLGGVKLKLGGVQRGGANPFKFAQESRPQVSCRRPRSVPHQFWELRIHSGPRQVAYAFEGEAEDPLPFLATFEVPGVQR